MSSQEVLEIHIDLISDCTYIQKQSEIWKVKHRVVWIWMAAISNTYFVVIKFLLKIAKSVSVLGNLLKYLHIIVNEYSGLTSSETVHIRLVFLTKVNCKPIFSMVFTFPSSFSLSFFPGIFEITLYRLTHLSSSGTSRYAEGVCVC